MVWVLPEHQMNKIVSSLPEVQRAVEDLGKEVQKKAEANMAEARNSSNPTDHVIEGGRVPAEKFGNLDYFVSLVGPAPKSVEFGHFVHNAAFPRYVAGLYILHRAAGLI